MGRMGIVRGEAIFGWDLCGEVNQTDAHTTPWSVGAGEKKKKVSFVEMLGGWMDGGCPFGGWRWPSTMYLSINPRNPSVLTRTNFL